MDPTRSFSDGQGVQWRVTERLAARISHQAPRRCLFFEAAHVIRRVCAYPPDWQELSDAELERLSWCL